jgi:uncharacterized protein
MMRLTEMVFPQGVPVDGYGPGFFRIGGVLYRGATLVLPGGAGPWAGLPDAAPFLAAAAEIDVLFVGTGAEIAQVPPAFRQALEAAGVGVEIMNSPAAARTYNVCLAEGRRVAAALMPV